MTEDEVQSIVEKYPIGPSGCPEWTSPDGSVRLILGNCLEVLPTLSGMDAVVTDPPYGVGEMTGGMKHDFSKSSYGGSWSDDSEYIERVCVPVVCLCRELVKTVALTPGTVHMMKYPQPDDVGCFWSPAAVSLSKFGFTTFHPILYYGWYKRAGKGNWPNGVEMKMAAEKTGHPCSKPVRAWQWLVEKVVIDFGIVCDPFMGSGTTGVACIRTGRRFVGIEIEPKYFEIAIERCKKEIKLDKSSFQIRPKPRQEPAGFFERKKK